MVTLSVDGRGRPTADVSGAEWYDPREGGPNPSVNGKYISIHVHEKYLATSIYTPLLLLRWLILNLPDLTLNSCSYTL